MGHKLIKLLLVLLANIMLSGCYSTGNLPRESGPERLGKLTTMDFYKNGPETADERKYIIKKVYAEFKKRVENGEVGDDLPQSVLNASLKRLPPNIFGSSIKILVFRYYWPKLRSVYDIDTLSDEKKIYVLTEFLKGVKKAIDIIEADKGSDN